MNLSPAKRKVESVEEENEEDIKPKRGRGRPRKMDKIEKIKVPGREPGRPHKTDSPKKSANETLESDEMYNEEESDEQAKQSGRGPGRPPKKDAAKSMRLISLEKEKVESEEEEKEDEEKDIKPKRGRGRPPKMNKKPVKIKVPGRGRGRPPKFPNSNRKKLLSPMKKNVRSKEELEEQDEEDVIIKRGRGRPRKTNKKPNKVTVPCRGRGRPPKSQRTNRHGEESKGFEDKELKENGIRQDSEEENVTHKKRGRGRPRSVEKTSINPRKSSLKSASNSKVNDCEAADASSEGSSVEDSSDSWESDSETENKEDVDWEMSHENYKQKPVKKGTRKSLRKVARGRGRPRKVIKTFFSPQRSRLKSPASKKVNDCEAADASSEGSSVEDSSDSWESDSESENKEDVDWEMSHENYQKRKPVKKGTRKSPREVNRPGKRKRYMSAFSSDEEEEDFEPGTPSKTTSQFAGIKNNSEHKEGDSEDERPLQKSPKRGRGRPLNKVNRQLDLIEVEKGENMEEEEKIHFKEEQSSIKGK